MSDTLHNQISAFLDGELPEHEAELLVRRLCSSEELRGVAARYSVIGEVMRGDDLRPASDIAARVMDSVSREPTITEGRGWFKGLTRPLAGVAVAATVAGLALFSLQSFQAPDRGGENAVAQSVAPSSDLVANDSEQISTELRKRLNLYQVKYALQTPGHRQWAGLAHVPSASETAADGLTVADTVDKTVDEKKDNETANEEQQP